MGANDPDGDVLTYAVAPLPVGATFDPATRTFTWVPSATQLGAHALTVTVSDGLASSSQPLTLTVVDGTPPTVILTAPTEGATVTGAVTVSASASDDVGVEGVQVLLDGSPLGGQLILPPYELAWDATTTANGFYALSARAHDAAGHTAMAPTVGVTVDNMAAAPTISPDGGSFTDSVTVSLATATPGAAIRYTADGIPPTSTTGTLYASPFTLSGSATVQALASKSGMTDSAIASARFTIIGSVAPTLTFTGTPTTATPGQTSILTWTSTGAASCTASGGWSGAKATSGNETVIPTATTTYTLGCTGSGGTVTESTTVTVMVSSTFSLGDRARVISGPLDVYATPSTTGAVLGVHATGDEGIVVGGAVLAGGLIWWEIDYDMKPDGWSVEQSLERAPVLNALTSIAPATVMAGATYRYEPALVRSPEVLAVSFYLLDAPAGMASDSSSGVVTWTPTADQVGTHRTILVAALLTVTDYLWEVQEIQQEWSVTVLPAGSVTIAQQSITAAAGGTIVVGGTGTVFDGATITIPPGALSFDQVVSVVTVEGVPVSPTALASDDALYGPPFMILADGATTGEVEIALPVDALQLPPGAAAEELRFVRQVGIDPVTGAIFSTSIIKDLLGPILTAGKQVLPVARLVDTLLDIYTTVRDGRQLVGKVSIGEIIRIVFAQYDVGFIPVSDGKEFIVIAKQLNPDVFAALQTILLQVRAYYRDHGYAPLPDAALNRPIKIVFEPELPMIGQTDTHAPDYLFLHTALNTAATPDELARVLPFLRTTIAHEYLHLIQFASLGCPACDIHDRNRWFMESLAVFMEGQVYPNDSVLLTKLPPFNEFDNSVTRDPLAVRDPQAMYQIYQRMLLFQYLKTRHRLSFDPRALWYAAAPYMRDPVGALRALDRYAQVSLGRPFSEAYLGFLYAYNFGRDDQLLDGISGLAIKFNIRDFGATLNHTLSDANPVAQLLATTGWSIAEVAGATFLVDIDPSLDPSALSHGVRVSLDGSDGQGNVYLMRNSVIPLEPIPGSDFSTNNPDVTLNGVLPGDTLVVNVTNASFEQARFFGLRVELPIFDWVLVREIRNNQKVALTFSSGSGSRDCGNVAGNPVTYSWSGVCEAGAPTITGFWLVGYPAGSVGSAHVGYVASTSGCSQTCGTCYLAEGFGDDLNALNPMLRAGTGDLQAAGLQMEETTITTADYFLSGQETWVCDPYQPVDDESVEATTTRTVMPSALTVTDGSLQAALAALGRPELQNPEAAFRLDPPQKFGTEVEALSHTVDITDRPSNYLPCLWSGDQFICSVSSIDKVIFTRSGRVGGSGVTSYKTTMTGSVKGQAITKRLIGF